MQTKREFSTGDLIDLTTLETLASLGVRRGRDLLGQLVKLFADQGPAAFVSMRQALDAGDAATVRETAHSLKGSYRSLGTPRLAELAERLEMLGRASELESAPAVLDRLEADFASTLTALEEFLTRQAREKAPRIDGA